jgi:hypothetical protein
VWETGAGPGDGAVGGNFGSRTTGGGLEPGFYNVVIMIEERHNGVAADGYPDHLDDNGNDINNGTGTSSPPPKEKKYHTAHTECYIHTQTQLYILSLSNARCLDS